MNTKPESRICLGLDGLSFDNACLLINVLAGDEIEGGCYAVKIHDLYYAEGPRIIGNLKKAGAKRMWVDAKIHDTPDAARLLVAALVRNGADIVTVHAAGGIPMMKAAVEAAFAENVQTEIWAVTLLTSLGKEEINRDFGQYGNSPTSGLIVLNRARMAQEAGVNTVVCSAQEVGMLSRIHDLQGMKFVVPGTRSVGVAASQQKRSGTPAQAITDGATFLVVNSQVTKAKDPFVAFKFVSAEIASALKQKQAA